MPRVLGPAAVVLALLSASVASATTLVARSVEELARLSAVVVRGVVLDSSTVVDAEGTPWTHHTLAVSRSWREPLVGTVDLWQRGGVLPDGSVLLAPGDLSVQPGDEVVAFLRRQDDGRLVSTALGWSVFDVGVGGAIARNSEDFGLFVEEGGVLRPARPGEGRPPQTVAELEQRLADAVGGAQ